MSYTDVSATTTVGYGRTVPAPRVRQRRDQRRDASRVRSLKCRATADEETTPTATALLSREGESRVAELKERMQSWTWREKRINYLVVGEGPPLLLIHGLAASMLHYRKNIPVLSQSYTVYAIDLLGFGGSEKAPIDYSMELWRDLIIDFVNDWIEEPFLIVGNSVGSLASLMATVEMQERVMGVALLNCAGAMNNKGLKDDWRIRVALPIFYLIDFLLSIRPIAQYLFNRLAKTETIRSALSSIYCNKEAVDDELVEIFESPSQDEGALDVFVSILTGPAGPRPQDLVRQITCPMLVLWGEEDFFTPFDNPVSNFLKTWPNATFIPLRDTGHTLHDDCPERVHEHLLPWLKQTYTSESNRNATNQTTEKNPDTVDTA